MPTPFWDTSIYRTGTVGIEPTHIIRPSTIQLSRRYLYRFPITVHVHNGLVLLGAKVPVEIPVLIFKVSL
ncbi:TPA: hypothetical protein VAN46_002216 [Streptococcus agalactiae]|uniref:hypothetical protein n=1 Tax=Streptococcus agalactiae TaxID=1311 RepID=UPI00167F81FC|nr:hypothetical protein [Streptococcus agalactiae]MDK6305509.1 hypothetical protein [Streptococcus agalactiae]HEN2711266.1 hypothetical protein [Streptococcus agalactiae]HEO2075369.1 hypothetical protein [Streptococcus agalactiae]HEO2076656.1 hypothetical protein [Streptococcus agalactiae]HEO4841922.1 hypothetical protein [Streptococcus agalactiae]